MGAFDFAKELALDMVDPTGLGRAAADYVTGDSNDAAEATRASLPSADDKQVQPMVPHILENFLPEDLRKKVEAEQRFEERLDSEEPTRDKSKDHKRIAGFRLGQDYTKKAPDTDPNAPVDLTTPEARMAALDGFTQNYGGDTAVAEADGTDPGQNECGATTLIAGAMLADGNKGVEAMMDLAASDPNAGKFWGPQFEDIKKRLADGEPLTQSDLRMVQMGVHEHLQREHRKAGYDPASTGVDGAVIQDTIKNNEKLRGYFAQENMSVNFVDNTGAGKPGHFVLDVGAKDGRERMVYDPQAREDGQVINTEGGVDSYDDATYHRFGP